jgi:tRNA (adenine57-N1/adenine58-N1)-methyltransferase
MLEEAGFGRGEDVVLRLSRNEEGPPENRSGLGEEALASKPEAPQKHNRPTREFRPGERVLLVDSKGRRSFIRLRLGGIHHTHTGVVRHDDLIGRLEGSEVHSERGAKYLAFRPTMAELIIGMPRGAQVIYPKDLGAILIEADIFPGAKVIEAGVGSGALSMALLRAGASVVGYELREDFADRALANVRDAIGSGWPYEIRLADIYSGIQETEVDRILLDLPEPHRTLPHAERALRPGGILLSYLPSMTQVGLLVEALAQHRFGLMRTFEVMIRDWQVGGRIARPAHRMVAHTAFLTIARRLAD